MDEANRDQCTEYADGPIQEYYKPGPPHNNEDFSIMRSLRASLASQKWKQEAGEKLVEFCKKLSQTEEGDAIIGMHISGGIYGEWHYWGFVDHDPDTGKAMTAYFRNWLRNKYGTDKKLQQAWNSAQWTLETATVPGVEERTKTQFGQFKDPKASGGGNRLHRRAAGGCGRRHRILLPVGQRELAPPADHGRLLRLPAHDLQPAVGRRPPARGAHPRLPLDRLPGRTANLL